MAHIPLGMLVAGNAPRYQPPQNVSLPAHLNPCTQQYQQPTLAFTTLNDVTLRFEHSDSNNSVKSYYIDLLSE